MDLNKFFYPKVGIGVLQSFIDIIKFFGAFSHKKSISLEYEHFEHCHPKLYFFR
jgi:hypothetical protein